MDAVINPTEIKFPAGPGHRLRVAREALKLSVDQVAHYLRLEKKVISQIEADRYENMTCFTFIRGYLRSYARLVDLPPDELVIAFDSLSLEEKPGKNVRDAFVVRDYSAFSVNWKGQWVPYIGIFLASLVVIWVSKSLGFGLNKIFSMLGFS